MLQPTIQIIIIITTSFFVGFGISWWWMITYSRQSINEQKLQQELAGLRRHYDTIREDTHALRGQLKETEQQRQKTLELLRTTSGYTHFMEARTKLETARKCIQQLKMDLSQRDRQIYELKDAIITLRKRLAILTPLAPVPQALPENVIRMPLSETRHDELQKIDGITQEIAHQLRSMGIVSYQQIAECTPSQFDTIQRLLKLPDAIPMAQWVESAKQLFNSKYGKPRQPLQPQKPGTTTQTQHSQSA